MGFACLTGSWGLVIVVDDAQGVTRKVDEGRINDEHALLGSVVLYIFPTLL